MTARSESRRLRRYVVTGGAAAGVDLAGFALLAALGAQAVPAALASFLVANVANFALSARFAFGHAPSPRRYPAFLAAASAGLCVNVGVTAASALVLPMLAAKVAGIGVAFVANFAANSRLVFPASAASPSAAPASPPSRPADASGSRRRGTA